MVVHVDVWTSAQRKRKNRFSHMAVKHISHHNACSRRIPPALIAGRVLHQLPGGFRALACVEKRYIGECYIIPNPTRWARLDNALAAINAFTATSAESEREYSPGGSSTCPAF